MPRLSLKPDARFFENIAMGAVGARTVVADLERYGHEMVELENGSTDTRLWKDVKRKRVRIPDLICRCCGQRVESRAKSGKPELSMSHSPTEAERAWDFGMVDTDVIAFPVCERVAAESWGLGRLKASVSYWQSRDRIRWDSSAHINYFRTAAFRAAPPSGASTKGVTEGTETAIRWDAIFATFDGTVESVGEGKIVVRRASGRRYTWRDRGLPVRVVPGLRIRKHQVLASSVAPVPDDELTCPRELPPALLSHLLASPERTQRFAGVKLARLTGDPNYREPAWAVLGNAEEDLYVRLEAAAYLASVCGESAATLFEPYLRAHDDQTRLEAVVALAEAKTPEAATLLSRLLDDRDGPYFLRSAAAWALGRIGSPAAAERLIAAFADVRQGIREEALEAVSTLVDPPLRQLVDGVLQGNDEVAAGSAEALRRLEVARPDVLDRLVSEARRDSPRPWAIWLLAHLPRTNGRVAKSIAPLQESNPEAHFAIVVLWSFIQSWIARSWELRPVADLPGADESEHDV